MLWRRNSFCCMKIVLLLKQILRVLPFLWLDQTFVKETLVDEMNYWPITSFVSLWHFETFDKSLILFLLTQMSNNIPSYISKININACCHLVWKHIFKSTEYICYLSKTHQKCVPNYVSGITISWEHFISTWIYILILINDRNWGLQV